MDGLYIYRGKYIRIDDLGGTLFLETLIWLSSYLGVEPTQLKIWVNMFQTTS